MPLNPAVSEQYQNYIIRYEPEFIPLVEESYGGVLQKINEVFAVLYVPEEKVSNLEINSYSYNTIPNCYTYMDYEALQTSGVLRLQEHPYLNLRGNGTLIAVIDSGIDYQNPLFLKNGKSRIAAIWDQTINGAPSSVVSYGKVFFKDDIDAALEHANPLEYLPSVDTNGHGTMLAAVAAGGRNVQENFSGAAPEAYILAVKLKPAKNYLRSFYLYERDAELFQEDDIMMGISFAIRISKMLQCPLSICLGIGSNQGAHIGKSPLCQYINYITGFSQNVVSVAAGNEGTARHHYEGNLNSEKEQDIIELKIGEKEQGFTMEFWGSPPDLYKISIQSPTGEKLEVSTALRSRTQELNFVFVETKVWINYVDIERTTGYTLVYFRFLDPAAGIWKIWIRKNEVENSQYHIWLPCQTLISGDTYFLQSTPYGTITSPGDAEDGITMTAYQSRDDSLYLRAGRGFLPDGKVKPTFAAPGVDIRVPFSDGLWGSASGTSLSAAQNTGIAALLFEWALVRRNQPFFNGNNVKAYLQRGTQKEKNRVYPNPDLGYGKIDLYRSFQQLS